MDLQQIQSAIIWEKVRFERTKEDLNNRQTFVVETSIAKGENYLAAFDFVKATVNHELGIDCEDLDKKRKRLNDKIFKLKSELEASEQELENAKQFHRKAADFLEKLGLNPADIFSPNPTDAIPF